MRLPLWASASSRRLPFEPAERWTGCEFSQLVGAGRRVAHVADRQLAAERAQVVLLEDLADEAQRALGDDVAVAVGGRDAGRLLAAVLERVEREVRQPGDVVAGRVYPEDPAFVARAVTVVEGLVCRHRRVPRSGLTGTRRA